MKLKVWLLSALAPLTAVSVLAQASNSVPSALTPPPPVPAAAPAAPAAAAPAAPAPKKTKASKPKAKHKKTTHATAMAPAHAAATNTVVVLNPPGMATVKCDVLDVRGLGSFAGEVITHVKKGETVTVLEEITRGHVHSNEPAQWSRIVMPTNTPVWVDGDFIEPESKAVRVKRVNVRGGPGENYSIVARLDKGTVVKEIRKHQGWLEIETPANAFGFVASEYLDMQPAGATPPAELAATPPPSAPTPAPAAPATLTPVPTPAPAPAPAPPVPQTVVVNVPTETPPAPAKPVEAAAPTPPVEAAPVTPVAPAPTPASQSEQELAAARQATAPSAPVAPPVVVTPAPVAAQPEATNDETPRIVTREGFVHRARNIQAPSGFELHDIKSGELIEYLQPAPGQKKFKIFVGTRVRLTGPEFLDPAWPRTPILHVQTVDLMP